MSTGESTQNVESATAGAGTQYQVMINMSAQTVSGLVAGNYKLYGFKAVRSSQGGGAPLVWFQTGGYATRNSIVWTEQYQAYTSMSQIVPNERIIPGFAADIALGQVLEVDAQGIGKVVDGGQSTAFSVFNRTSTQYTCGLCTSIGSEASPICAFPLYGNQMDVITPVNQILLMFSTHPLAPGTAIGLSTGDLQGSVRDAYTPAIMVDLSGASGREVSFDINTGWDWGGSPWGEQVPANANIVPLLIQSW